MDGFHSPRASATSCLLRIFLFCATCALVAFSGLSTADAQPRGGGNFGAGGIVGEPIGGTGKYFFNKGMAIDFHAGARSANKNGFKEGGLYANFLWHFDVGTSSKYFDWPFYVGGGIGLLFFDGRSCGKFRGCKDHKDDDFGFQIRVPIGVSFQLTKFPGEVFLETVPNNFLVPDFYIDVDFAAGFRYYF